MPFNLPFNFPFFYNNYNYIPRQKPLHNNYLDQHNNNVHTVKSGNYKNIQDKKDSEMLESSESFLEIFGLKLYLDDIIIICILYFLYTENVQDDELFICLILLLLS